MYPDQPTSPAPPVPSPYPAPVPEPEPAAPPSAFPLTRAALSHAEMTRGQTLSAHGEALRDYGIREAFFRDTRTLGNSRRTIANMPINHIKTFVIAEDVTRGHARTCYLEDVTIGEVRVQDLEGAELLGDGRRLALLQFRMLGTPPDGVQIVYRRHVPLVVGEIAWGTWQMGVRA